MSPFVAEQTVQTMYYLAFGQDERALGEYTDWVVEQARHITAVELHVRGETDAEKAASLIDDMLRTGLTERAQGGANRSRVRLGHSGSETRAIFGVLAPPASLTSFTWLSTVRSRRALPARWSLVALDKFHEIGEKRQQLEIVPPLSGAQGPCLKMRC